MYCHTCGVPAETRNVTFYQNIGMLVMRQTKWISGDLCKRCVHKFFWELTGWTLITGWWGMISFVVNWFFILNNTVRYLSCLGMKPPGEGAQGPRLEQATIDALAPDAEEILLRVHGDAEPLESVANDVSKKKGVPPEQVYLFVVAATEAARKSSPR